MGKLCYLYWIHTKNMTDILTEGYVGISYRPKLRFIDHCREKPKFKSMQQSILLAGDVKYIKEIEKKLRPRKNIGYNIAAGGGIPPSQKGVPKSNEWKAYMSIAMRKPKVNKENINVNKRRSFICIDSEGNEYVVHGLREFCNEKGLRQGCMSNIAAGRQKSPHKGWICKKV